MRTVRTTPLTATGTSALVPIDHYSTPGGIAVAVYVLGGATVQYKVEHTYDDIYAPGFSPASATWIPHATLGPALTATQDGNYAYPPIACRLNVGAYTNPGTGSVQLIVNQSGIA